MRSRCDEGKVLGRTFTKTLDSVTWLVSGSKTRSFTVSTEAKRMSCKLV